MSNWIYPLIAFGLLASLFVLAYLYVRWRDRRDQKRFERKLRQYQDGHGNDITHLVDP